MTVRQLLHPKLFTLNFTQYWHMQHTDHIKERLLNRFGTFGDERPPAGIEKIAEVVARELHHLRVEQAQSEERISRNLVRKIRERHTLRRVPAATMLQVLPGATKKSHYTPQEHLETVNERGQVIFLSPLFPVRLQPVRIAYRYWNGQLWKQNNAAELHPMNTGQHLPSGAANEVLLGIHVTDGAELPEEIMLYLEAENGVAGMDRRRVVAALRAETDENDFPLSVQPRGTELPSEEIAGWEERQWLLRASEQPTAEKYRDRFLRIGGFDRLPQTTIVAVLQQVVQMLQGEKIYWLKLVFPVALQQRDLLDMQLGFNCFPVLNRRIRTREESPHLPVTTFPLRQPQQRRDGNEPPEYFLGLQRIFYGSGFEFQRAIVPSFGEAQPGEYGVQRGGVLSFHAEEARRQLAYTLTLLDTEKEVLQNAYGQRLQHGEIGRHFNQIRESLGFLREKLAVQDVREEDWFLHCKPVNERENVLVRFWVGQGVKLKKIIYKIQ